MKTSHKILSLYFIIKKKLMRTVVFMEMSSSLLHL